MTEKKTKAQAKSNKTHVHKGAQKTARNKQRILDHLDEHGDFVTTACQKLKLSRTQFYAWLDDDPEFAEAYTEIKEKHIDLMEANLVEIANTAQRDSDRVRAIESYLRSWLRC